jgi:hypothetical protein
MVENPGGTHRVAGAARHSRHKVGIFRLFCSPAELLLYNIN